MHSNVNRIRPGIKGRGAFPVPLEMIPNDGLPPPPLFSVPSTPIFRGGKARGRLWRPEPIKGEKIMGKEIRFKLSVYT